MHKWEKANQGRWRDTTKERFHSIFIKRWMDRIAASRSAVLLILMGFLLGRAMILQQLAPFGLAYFAVLYYVRGRMLPWISVSLFIGSLLSVGHHTGILVMSMILFLLLQKGLEKFEKSDLSIAPILVAASDFLVHLFSDAVTGKLGGMEMLLIVVNALLSFVLTLIFIQAVPIVTLKKKKNKLKSEEIICLMITLASVMTGTVGWSVHSISLEHVLSRYLILLFALVGGAPLGASVGVITGMILSLADVNAVYQMSLLAFAGMLAGLLKEGRRLAVAFGMLIGTSLLTVYIGNQSEVIHSTIESGIALFFFLLTPGGLIRLLSVYVPGTAEHVVSQQDYARRVRDATAGRVEQFSEVFRQLACSFKPISLNQEVEHEEKVGHFMNSIAEQSCKTCWKQNECWDRKFYQTYKLMSDMMTVIEDNEQVSKKDIPAAWGRICVKSEKVLEIMKRDYHAYKNNQQWKKQIADSRQLVSEQLSGVSQVMEDLAREIKREGIAHAAQEDHIFKALDDIGLSIHSVDIISLDKGHIEIEIVHQFAKGYDECRKLIAPLLTDIIGENIVVVSELFPPEGEGYATVNFGSAKAYEIETGIASAAKGGELLSGDSFRTMDLGNGKLAVALSDGMGNGERARLESSTALTILQQLLESGMDEKVAIKSVNSVLLLRSSDEMYATVDLALINRFNAHTTFLKIGSAPSFIKRGKEVLVISSSNLPVGILQEIDVELVSVQLQPHDMLIMMTDGIYDAPGHTINKELWLKRVIQEIQVTDPQDFADCILERVVRTQQGEIVDDMTVLVSRVEKYIPEWATVSIPGAVKLERSKTVS